MRRMDCPLWLTLPTPHPGVSLCFQLLAICIFLATSSFFLMYTFMVPKIYCMLIVPFCTLKLSIPRPQNSYDKYISGRPTHVIYFRATYLRHIFQGNILMSQIAKYILLALLGTLYLTSPEDFHPIDPFIRTQCRNRVLHPSVMSFLSTTIKLAAVISIRLLKLML